MKYLNEYRDPAVARGLVRAIPDTATRRWVLMEVCGGQTHTIVKQGLDELLAPAVEMIHGPGCPVCVTPLEQIDKALTLAARPDVIFTSFGDMLRVPGSECDLQQVRARGRRGAGGVFAAGRAGTRHQASRQAGGLLRGRLRDHGAGQRHGGLARAGAGHRQFQRAGLPRDRAAGHGGDPGFAGQPGAGIPRRRPRLHRHGLDGVRADRRALPGADRGHRVRAGRHPGRDRAGGAPAGGGPARGGEPVRPRRPPGWARRRRGSWSSRSSIWPTGSGAGSATIPESGLGLRPEYSDFDAELRFGLEDIAVEEPAECRAGEVLRGTAQAVPVPGVRHRSARRSARSARRWCHPKEPAPPTTTSAVIGRPWLRRRDMTSPSATVPPVRSRSSATDRVQLGHGSGGKMSAALLKDRFLPHLGNPVLEQLGDAAVLPVNGAGHRGLDRHVRGEPGRVSGRKHRVARGARHPQRPGDGWARVRCASPRASCWRKGSISPCLTASWPPWPRRPNAAGVPVVSGDTKVVERGKADGLYINTTGIGMLQPDFRPAPDRARPGRCGAGERPDRLAWYGNHGGARGYRLRGGRSRATRRPCSRWWSCCGRSAGSSVHVLRDPDPRRPGQRPQRNRGGLAGRRGAGGWRAAGPCSGRRRMRSARAGPDVRGQ